MSREFYGNLLCIVVGLIVGFFVGATIAWPDFPYTCKVIKGQEICVPDEPTPKPEEER